MSVKSYRSIRPILSIAFFILFLSIPIQAIADDIRVSVDNLRYIIHEETETASVVEWSGYQIENLVIPDFIIYEEKEFRVTEISSKAFYNGQFHLVGSLTIGNSVTKIGEYAFWGCHELTGDLIIPDSITEIGE